MSMFENDQYTWRETYFVLFDSAKRPKLEVVEKLLTGLDCRFTLTNPAADEEGRFESVTVLAPDDFAALDVCYVDGEEVVEQAGLLAEEMEGTGCEADEQARLDRVRKCDGRFDVLHFEQRLDLDDQGDPDEMLDPSALLVVLGALVELCDGIAIDPQSGSML